jgi:hypothetical protein
MVVRVQNDSNNDRWYMKIMDGRVQGPEDDPYIVGAQWLKANSKSILESATVFPCYIKTIIEIERST